MVRLIRDLPLKERVSEQSAVLIIWVTGNIYLMEEYKSKKGRGGKDLYSKA